MASSNLQPYRNNSNQETFVLANQSASGATYKVASRPLSQPYQISIERKLSAAGSNANDRVILKSLRTELNESTGKLATMSVKCEISIPKDDSVITKTVQAELVAVIASLLNEATAMEATKVNINALIDGMDL